jgi:hypothetical protein
VVLGRPEERRNSNSSYNTPYNTNYSVRPANPAQTYQHSGRNTNNNSCGGGGGIALVPQNNAILSNALTTPIKHQSDGYGAINNNNNNPMDTTTTNTSHSSAGATPMSRTMNIDVPNSSIRGSRASIGNSSAKANETAFLDEVVNPF